MNENDIANVLELQLPPFYLELRPNAKPKHLKLQRKTKAGLWETLFVVENIVDISTAAYMLRLAMIYRKVKTNKPEAHRVITFNGRQVFCSYYQKFTDKLFNLITNNTPFGLSINKGEEYLICHNQSRMQRESIAAISEYFSKLSHIHKGIKRFDFATPDPRDHYLPWGWMSFYDGHRISVAIDMYYFLYANTYKTSLTNPFLLIKKP